MRNIRSIVTDNVNKLKNTRLADCAFPHAEIGNSKQLGTCPVCGGPVIESPKAWGCANWKSSNGSCRFAIWKNMFGAAISEDTATELLAKGRTTKELEFVSKAGKPYKARLSVKNGKICLAFN
jgi:DNA topoisomerase-3